MEKKRDKRPMEKAMDLTAWQSAKTDPQGSWTGAPADPDDPPFLHAYDLYVGVGRAAAGAPFSASPDSGGAGKIFRGLVTKL